MPAGKKKTRPKANVAIRDFKPEDYPAILEVGNATFPDYPDTLEEWRYEDEHFDTKRYAWRRFVAVDPATDAAVGFADYSHMPSAFHPQRFRMWVNVHPERRGQGIGGALYDRAMEDLAARKAIAVRGNLRDGMPETLAFLERRGFREVMRDWESRLDLRAFDPAKFAAHAEPPPGIRIVTLADELKEDPEALRAVYDLVTEVVPDAPRMDPYTPQSYEMWRDYVVGGPWAFPEGFFLAKDGDRYVGESDLGKSEAQPAVLYTGFTGVRRSHRGRGVAMALKVRALTFAKGLGYAEVRTWNSTLNDAMLGINVKLGFVRQPAWIQVRKDLAEGAAPG